MASRNRPRAKTSLSFQRKAPPHERGLTERAAITRSLVALPAGATFLAAQHSFLGASIFLGASVHKPARVGLSDVTAPAHEVPCVDERRYLAQITTRWGQSIAAIIATLGNRVWGIQHTDINHSLCATQRLRAELWPGQCPQAPKAARHSGHKPRRAEYVRVRRG